MPDLPCDGDGVCMLCHAAAPPEVDLLRCSTCATPWHSPCLSNPPALADAARWTCPDCSADAPPPAPAPLAAGGAGQLVAAIRAIECDHTLSDQDKARRRQELLGGTAPADTDADDDEGDDVLEAIGKNFSCAFCMKLPERPVTTPCGHNFCLKCFQKWINSGKRTCGKCRAQIPAKMAEQPRINSALVSVIRMAKVSKNANSAVSAAACHYIRNDDRPDKAFTTERAKRAGKANASSGQIFVTIPPDHFGPILAENDPRRNMGVRVGETWEDRLECRQWGAHFPHVAGIAGQSTYGAQSVALSGGYVDDEDHGEWFLYTGSGGRDLSGNKRTNKEQSSDQKFEKLNAALRISCLNGYPVRVVRSHKEKRSSYAPERGVRYDGVYRIEKCWRKISVQGTFKVCRYLFVRCDNEPAPWTSDIYGDRPRPLPKVAELKGATDISERKGTPSWNFDDKEGWKWVKPPPISRKPNLSGDPETDKQIRRVVRRAQMSVAERLLKEFGCSICKQVMKEPLTTPCAHNFCKTCLLGAYDSQSSIRERSRGGRTLRAQKVVKKCPSCPTDICDFLANPQINREMMGLIESLQKKAVEEGDNKTSSDGSNGAESSGDDENTEALEKEEDESSLNDEDDGDRHEKTGGLLIVDSDAKDDGEVVKKSKGEDEKGQGDKKTKDSADAVVDIAVEEKQMEGSKKAENKQGGGQQARKRKGNAETVATNGGKRMKTAAGGGDDMETVVEEDGPLNGGTPMKRSRKSGEVDAKGSGGSPVASSPRRVTRSSAKAGEADGSPATRTRRASRADTGAL
ncbi:E3 ubiquitin-protein ligase ORTHRUS 2-like [Oryza brachyantha]|uniref:E3 ubiquitin-protein ligase ORTHRUS 2-like n=1 Tax=Oryza brachyantha TaxID=4533 RepID=UPI001ADBC586|nr:E3 ubiquitin-protein ligase ORTHRUS 2-like [Oryza brachyantha]